MEMGTKPFVEDFPSHEEREWERRPENAGKPPIEGEWVGKLCKILFPKWPIFP